MALTEPLSDGISAGPMAEKLTAPLGAARLLERTQTFRDRVKAGGGSIEDGSLENLYDPILRAVKDWGLLSELVFFGSGSAVEINSGSIPTIFDASGNEYDAIQTDTAKQAALDKNSVGGRWGAGFDGADDRYNVPDVGGSVLTSISVIAEAADGRFLTYDKSGTYHSQRTSSGVKASIGSGGDLMSFSPSSLSDVRIVSSFVDPNGTAVLRVDGDKKDSGVADENTVIGSNYNHIGESRAKGSHPYDGQLLLHIGMLNRYSEQNVNELESHIEGYYSI